MLFSGSNVTTGELRDLSDGTTHAIDLRQTYPGTSGYLDKFRPIYSHGHYTQTLYTDDIYVRKYTTSEPGHGEWESEESTQYDLADWSYRRSHVVLNSSGAGTNYQVPIIVHCGSGNSSANEVYLNSHCQTDFDDIRFTAGDGETPLNHWRESYAAGDEAWFWVEVKDDLDDTNRTIYIYYGNVLATTASDGHATFPLFDDFNRDNEDNVSGWIDDDGDGNAQVVSNRISITQNANEYCHVEQDGPSLRNFVVECKMQHSGAAAASWKNALTVYYGADAYVNLGWRGPPTTREDLVIHFGNGTNEYNYAATGDFTDDVIYHRLVFNNTHITGYYREVGGEWNMVASVARVAALNTTSYRIILGKGYEASSTYTNPDLDNNYSTSGNLGTDYIDNIFMRQYASQAPEHGAWGSEEVLRP